MPKKHLQASILCLFCACVSLPAFELDPALDQLKNALIFESADGQFYLETGLQLDWSVYGADNMDRNPPGFFFPEGGKRFDWSPRLTATFDAWWGDKLYAFVKWRWDDGVHPGLARVYGQTHDFRFDEAFVRYEVAGSALQVQAGRFVPIMGNFLNRQDNWDSGLVSYPMMYGQVTSVSDQTVPTSAANFAARRNQLDFPAKTTWLPAYWAQLYTQGIALFGNQDAWDYSLNVTNTAPSSRGVVWNEFDWSDPSYMMSLGYRISPALRIGVTGTYGAYLQESAEAALPAGKDIGDYYQRNLGLDLSWQKGLWSVWAEFLYTEFDVPNVNDDPSFFSYFVEARYNFKPRWWASARWNQQIYNKIETPTGSLDWDNDLYRIDLGLGHRPTRHTQIRLQYSYQQQDASFQNAENFVVLEFSLKL